MGSRDRTGVAVAPIIRAIAESVSMPDMFRYCKAAASIAPVVASCDC